MNDVNVVNVEEVTAVTTVPNVARLHLAVAVGTVSAPAALAGTETMVGTIEMLEATNAGGEAGLRRGRSGGVHPLIGGETTGLGPRRWMTLKSRTKEMTGRRRRLMIIDLPSTHVVRFLNFATCDKKCFVVSRSFHVFSFSSLKRDVVATLQNENCLTHHEYHLRASKA
jgi:hypothetical protein